jgi:valyl-tRNA synthetase
MIFFSLYLTKKLPFTQVLIHGLIRDKFGYKMSKSRDNGVDPNEVIDQYGADTLRLYLLGNCNLGFDVVFNPEQLTYY